MTYSLISITNEIRQNYFFFSRVANKSNIGMRVIELVSPQYQRHKAVIFQKIDLLANTHLRSQGFSLLAALQPLMQALDENENVSHDLQQKAVVISSMITELVKSAALPIELELKSAGLFFTPAQYKVFPLALSPATQELFEEAPRFFAAMQMLLQKIFQREYGNALYQGVVDATFLTSQQLILLFLFDQMIDGQDIRQLEPFQEVTLEESCTLQRCKVTREEVALYFSQNSHVHEHAKHALLMKLVSSFLSDHKMLCKAVFELVRIHVSPTLDELFRLLCLGALPQGIEKEKAAILTQMESVLNAASPRQFSRALTSLKRLLGESEEMDDLEDEHPQLLLALCCEMAKRGKGFLIEGTCALLRISFTTDVARIIRAICTELFKRDVQSIVSFYQAIKGEHLKRARREIAYFLVKTHPETALALYFQNHRDNVAELAKEGLNYLLNEERYGREFIKQLENTAAVSDVDLIGLVKLQEFLDRSSFLFKELLKHHGYNQACAILTSFGLEDAISKLLVFEEFLHLYRENSPHVAALFFEEIKPSLRELDLYLFCFRCKDLPSSDAVAILSIILKEATNETRQQCQVFFCIEFGINLLNESRLDSGFLSHLERIEDPERLLSVLGVWVKSMGEFSADLVEIIREILQWKKLKSYRTECNVILFEVLLKAELGEKQRLFWHYFEQLSDEESKVVFLLSRFTYLEESEIDIRYLDNLLKALKVIQFPVNIDENQQEAEDAVKQLVEIGSGVQQILTRYGLEEALKNCDSTEHALLAIEEFITLSRSENSSIGVNELSFLKTL